MDMQRGKIEFVQEFLKIQSVEIITQLEKIFHKESIIADANQFSAMTIEEFND
jgi:hypothetical protein